MPQRNGQNPIKAGGNFMHGGSGSQDPAGKHGNAKSNALHCSKCGTEIPPKPGFRPSSLKCPKCGAAPIKK